MATHITKEEDNFLRMVYLNYRVGTTALRRYFDNVHPNLPSDLSSPTNRSILVGLHKPPRAQRKVLYQEQWDILNPPSGSHGVSSADLDVTLMVCILRNLPPQVSPPTKGFDVLPHSTDVTPGAHIARIKYYKNFLVSHSKDGKLADVDFNTIWTDLEMAIHGLGNQQDVTDAADAKSKVLDYKTIKELMMIDKRLIDHNIILAEHTTRIAQLESEKATKKGIAFRSSKGGFNEFKDELMRSTILDEEVLDILISKCVLTLDDKDEIDSFSDQSSRNNKLLEILMHRPYHTFNIFVEALKESDQKCHTALLANMEAKITDKSLTLQPIQHKEDTADIEKQTVKLIKWFKTLVHEIDVDKTGILDKLSAKGVICIEDNAELKSAGTAPREKSRGILQNIIRKNGSSAYATFLDVLREDSCYQEYANKIEKTDVTQFDLELLYIGRQKREKKERKSRKKKGMTDYMIDEMIKWKKDDSLYIKTRATNQVFTCISKYNCVSVIGASGTGKTALVRHVALQLEKSGYTLYTVTYSKEIKDNYKSGRKTLYIVDDMCGNFAANQSQLEEWKKSLNDIKNILENGYCKLVLTCRLHVFRDKGFESLELFKTCECNVGSIDLNLTISEKEKMTEQYFGEHALEGLNHLGQYEFLPLLCKLYYIQRNDPQFKLDIFLKAPFSFYKRYLTQMYWDSKEGKYKYCALLLIVIFNNNLEGKNIIGNDPKVIELLEDISEVCDIDENRIGRKLKIQLETLEGTFVTYDGGIYKTIHDKLFDFLAFFFGTQEQLLDILIKHAKNRFVRERFVVTSDNENVHQLIIIPEDKLQMYMERVFKDMVSSSHVNLDIGENINLRNVKFRNIFNKFLRRFRKDEITALIETASTDFLNKMFVMKEEDIRDHLYFGYRKNEMFGIIISENNLQHYIVRWFNALTVADSTKEFMQSNRLLKCVTFCTAVNSYIKQITTEHVAVMIHTGSKDFINTMFIKSEHDIEDFANNRIKCCGIVIPDCMLQSYIDRWFDGLTKYSILKNDYTLHNDFHCFQHAIVVRDKFMKKNRLLVNLEFRIALRTYLRQLTKEKIKSIIDTAEDDFFNKMFVVTEDDINDNAKNRYEWFGIIISDDMLQLYIEKYFNRLTNNSTMVQNIHLNRAIKHVKGRTTLRTHMKQLSKVKIASLIQNAVHIFFNTMFVMTEEDIKENAEKKYECFAIVIPDDQIEQYIRRWFDYLIKSTDVSRTIEENRPSMNIKFRIALRTQMRKLTIDKIASIIQTSNTSFLIDGFVMTQDDIKYDDYNRFYWFGIVIPDDLLSQYIQRLFGDLIKTSDPRYALLHCRTSMNVAFQSATRTYMRKLTTENIASIIETATENFIHEMFVFKDNDITDKLENRYECWDIVIPDVLLQQYIERLFDILIKSYNVKCSIDNNKPLMNNSFLNNVQTFMRQLTNDKIASIFDTLNMSENNFLSIMFVMSNDDIQNNAENRYECLGVVIPDDLLEKYIERLFNDLTSNYMWFLRDNKYEYRPLINIIFRTDLRNYMQQLTKEKIDVLIRTSNSVCLNTMFVVSEDDINDNAENRYEWFSIVIPDDMLQQYIQEYFDRLTYEPELLKSIHLNRAIKNVKGHTALCTYMKHLTTEKTASLIQSAVHIFFDSMFVISEDDIKDDADNKYERFGIVIPEDKIQQYIQRLLYNLTKTTLKENALDRNRPLMNIKFRFALRTHMKQLTTEKISSIIHIANDDFLTTMFVMTDDDIDYNAIKRYKCIGIVISGDLKQQFIQRWFDYMIKTRIIDDATSKHRLFMNLTFRQAVRTYMRQLTKDNISSIIYTADDFFFNSMFAMTEDDIKNNDKNQYACFGIVIPDDLLNQVIQRWFDDLTNITVGEIYGNRLFKNPAFRSAIRIFMRDLSKEKVASLIHTLNNNLLNTMFVVIEDDINDNAKNRYEWYEWFGIVIPDDMLQLYIQEYFDRLTNNSHLLQCIHLNRAINNVNGISALRTYMKHLTTEKIASLIQSAGLYFLDKMFVMTENEIKDDTENNYECFGIVIPEDKIQQYIQRWLHELTDMHSVEDVLNRNRPLMNIKFRYALRTHMKQLTTEKIALIIQTASEDFLTKMFVMTEDDINENAKNIHLFVGIVIPDDLLQQFIHRWFDYFIKTDVLLEDFSENRLHLNLAFRHAVRTYMSQLTNEKIVRIIETSNANFINSMFVITKKDVNDRAEIWYEYFGIIIPDDQIQQYIQQWFRHLTKTKLLKKFLNKSRLLTNVTFRSTVRTYMKQLNNEKIVSLIKAANNDFLNLIFVMYEHEIKYNAENRYECLGIVIPHDLFIQYICRWIESTSSIAYSVKEYIADNRSFMNKTFITNVCSLMGTQKTEYYQHYIKSANKNTLNTMFVMTKSDIKYRSENRYECIGFVIPDDLLQLYIKTWFTYVTNADSVTEYVNSNRPFVNSIFKTALCTFIRQLDREDIRNLIQTGSCDFVNTMFVITEDDINDNPANRLECIGIVIPIDLLQHYIERLIGCLTKADSVKKCFEVNRCFMDESFRISIQIYTKQLTRGKIRNLIQTGSSDFINSMFVMTEDAIKENAENRYECFGIVIPDDLLVRYVGILFDVLTKAESVMKTIKGNRCFMNSTFRVALKTYSKQLTNERIEKFLLMRSTDFANTIFVMTDEDIKENSENRLECFGIVIPDALLLQYIGILFDGLTKADSVKKTIDANRCFMKSTFRVAIQTYTKQLTRGKIRNLIQSGSRDFVNSMFVMTEDDNKDNADNKYICFCIILPEDLLHQYIENWFYRLTDVKSVKNCMDVNRLFLNVTFRTSMRNFTKKLDTEKIASIIDTAKRDFLNTMFVMTEEDIRDNAENNYECFGIVIPDEMLQTYIDRWLNSVTDADSVKECFEVNRPLKNVAFRTLMRNFMKQLDTEKIASIIDAAGDDFLNTMFVMTEEDICDQAVNQYERFGIVISNCFFVFRQYIARWFKCLAEANSVKECMNANRCLLDVSFRTALHTYMIQLDEEEIQTLIQTGSSDFLNTNLF